MFINKMSNHTIIIQTLHTLSSIYKEITIKINKLRTKTSFNTNNNKNSKNNNNKIVIIIIITLQ